MPYGQPAAAANFGEVPHSAAIAKIDFRSSIEVHLQSDHPTKRRGDLLAFPVMTSVARTGVQGWSPAAAMFSDSITAPDGRVFLRYCSSP